jgi:hypothetical protein
MRTILILTASFFLSTGCQVDLTELDPHVDGSPDDVEAVRRTPAEPRGVGDTLTIMRDPTEIGQATAFFDGENVVIVSDPDADCDDSVPTIIVLNDDFEQPRGEFDDLQYEQLFIIAPDTDERMDIVSLSERCELVDLSMDDLRLMGTLECGDDVTRIELPLRFCYEQIIVSDSWSHTFGEKSIDRD